MTRTTRNRRLASTMTRAGAGGLLTAALLVGGLSASANASSACGEYSYGFEGTRLLNDSISTSAGPYPISLPAGTYDVTLVSRDAHDTQADQVGQEAERWFVMLDSGYTSPPANDIPDDANDMTTVFSAQEVGDSTAISVHHLGQGGVNSVGVVCVGFTTVEVEEPVVAPPTTTTTTTVAPAAAPEPTPAPAPKVEAPKVEAKAVAKPLPTRLAQTGPEEVMYGLTGAALMLIGFGQGMLQLEARRRRAATISVER